MHVVIGGYGRVGRFMAHTLEDAGHSVAVIDRDPGAFEVLDDTLKGRRLVGEVFDRETLERAGIAKADCYAAVTSGDNSNVVSARIAKQTFKVPTVLARIYDPRRAELYRELDIRTISSVEWAAAQLLAMIANPRLRSEYQFGEGEVQLIEVEAPVTLVDSRLPEFEHPGEIKVVVVVRDHVPIIPVPGMRVERGDRLYVAVARSAIDKFERVIGKGMV